MLPIEITPLMCSNTFPLHKAFYFVAHLQLAHPFKPSTQSGDAAVHLAWILAKFEKTHSHAYKYSHVYEHIRSQHTHINISYWFV